MLDQNIPHNLRDLISRELDRDEKVLWSGMPKPHFFSAISIGSFLFAIPWTAFAVFWMTAAAGFQIPQFNKGFDFFPLFGIPFLLVGIRMLASPLVAYRKQLKTVYLITNQRAITIDGGGRSTTIQSHFPEKLKDLYRREHSDGSGDVLFQQPIWTGDSETRTLLPEIGFLRIHDAKSVENILRSVAELG
jgi:hypothetical protein